MPRLSTLPALVALSLILTPVAARAETENRLRIGVVLPLSGSLAPVGRDVLDGMEMALQEYQQQSPARAKMITLIKGDDQGSMTRASEAVQKLYRLRKAHVVIGSVASHVNIQLARIAKEEKRPIVFPVSSDAQLGLQNPYVFMTAIGWDRQGQLLARFAANFLKKQKALIIYDPQSPYQKAMADSFKEQFQRENKAIVELPWDGVSKKANEIAKAAVAEKADSIFYPGFYPEVAQLVEALRQEGIRVPVLGPDGWDSPNLDNTPLSDIMKGNYFLSQFSPRDPSPQVRRFSLKFQELTGRTATAFAALGYDAMALVLDAFQHNRSGTTESLVEALTQARQVPSSVGNADMGENHQLLKTGTVMFTQKQGAQFIIRY